MQIDSLLTEKIVENFNKYNEIAIISHRNPDGDTLGSTLALYEYLVNLGKNVTPIVPNAIGKVFNFLPHIKNFKQEFNPIDFDLIIACDCATSHMTEFTEKHPELFKQSQPFINIDHHGCNDNFGTINLVIESPSTTCIIFELLKNINAPITNTMATNLLTGLYTDTGSLMHGNTTPESYRISSYLLKKGADLKTISKNIFCTKEVSKLKLWGKIMENVHLDDEENIALATITQDDLDEFGATHDDLSGVIDFINAIPEANVSIILTEKDNKVKGSIRTQKDIDVSKIAAQFGGGGHAKAAGFMVPGHLQKKVIYEIIED